MRLKAGDKYRFMHEFGPSPQGYLVHIVAIVDGSQVVYKYYGKHKQWWHYIVEPISLFEDRVHRSTKMVKPR